jgi:hypothetical protein
MSDLVVAEIAIEWRGDGFFVTQTEAIRASEELKQAGLDLGGEEKPLGKVN